MGVIIWMVNGGDMMDLSVLEFSKINLANTFFDSLRSDYTGFDGWFEKKKKRGEEALVLISTDRTILGFLYTKIEDDEVDDVVPALPALKRLKIGTMKIVPHGTRLGERFIKKAFDKALENDVQEIYVTVFPKHEALILLYQKYGFKHIAMKSGEQVWVKRMFPESKDVVQNYPLIKLDENNCYLLGIMPKFHTRLFPDSKLLNESPNIIKDISHTNSIHKIYLSSMNGMEKLAGGDVLLIYRTSDQKGPARFRSVATSLCVIEEYKNINEFESKSDFLSYCSAYSVFSDAELNGFWDRKRYPHIIKFTYNASLNKRPTRGDLLDHGIISASKYAGFQEITTESISLVAELGKINASIIFNTP